MTTDETGAKEEERREIGEIEEIVHRETRAWDTRDVDLLLSIFHPDLVWLWPPSPADHDPLTRVMPMGRFDRRRWAAGYDDLFATHRPVRNVRLIRRIEVSPGGTAPSPSSTSTRSGGRPRGRPSTG
jgi:hypothetical protein